MLNCSWPTEKKMVMKSILRNLSDQFKIFRIDHSSSSKWRFPSLELCYEGYRKTSQIAGLNGNLRRLSKNLEVSIVTGCELKIELRLNHKRLEWLFLSIYWNSYDKISVQNINGHIFPTENQILLVQSFKDFEHLRTHTVKKNFGRQIRNKRTTVDREMTSSSWLAVRSVVQLTGVESKKKQ